MPERPVNQKRLAELIDYLMHDHWRVREAAARQIKRLGPVVVPVIVVLSTDPHPRMRTMAAYILGRIWTQEPDIVSPKLPRHCLDGMPRLSCLLRTDPDAGVRAAAARSLGSLAEISTAPALCRAASDASADVRLGVAQALGCFDPVDWNDAEERRLLPDSITSTLLRLMDDSDDEVREWAIRGLDKEEYDCPEVHARVWQALSDQHAEVRGAAAKVLATFGDPFLMARLPTLLREERTQEPYYFAAALTLADPVLLPAVVDAAKQWSARMEQDSRFRGFVTRVIRGLAMQACRTCDEWGDDLEDEWEGD